MVHLKTHAATLVIELVGLRLCSTEFVRLSFGCMLRALWEGAKRFPSNSPQSDPRWLFLNARFLLRDRRFFREVTQPLLSRRPDSAYTHKQKLEIPVQGQSGAIIFDRLLQ